MNSHWTVWTADDIKEAFLSVMMVLCVFKSLLLDMNEVFIDGMMRRLGLTSEKPRAVRVGVTENETRLAVL